MFTILDTRVTNALLLIRHGWFSPRYELTDNGFTYGAMTYSRFTRRTATVKTANSGWVFKCAGLFTRNMVIIDDAGVEIGTAVQGILRRKVVLSLKTGFKAEFYRPSIWSREHIWEADGCGQIMQITANAFSWKDSVNINNSMAPQAVIPLLIFLGEHLIILQRRRRATH